MRQGTATVRRARHDEAAALAAVHEASAVAGFANAFPQDRYPFPREEVQSGWHGLVADGAARILVSDDARGVVGFAVVRAGWLERLFVHPRGWNLGIGSALHDRALAELRALGSRECRLWVLEENDRARRFYERRGWRENGERRVVPFPPQPLDVGYTRELA